MKQRLPAFESTLCEHVEQHYDFAVAAFEFVPVGDSAFSYIVRSASQECRYLKVFDMSTDKGRLGVERLHRYLPLIAELSNNSLFPNVAKPYSTADGELHCDVGRYGCVLFEYVEGDTLADAYPFTDELQSRIAADLATLHSLPVSQLQSRVVRETYDIGFGEALHANLRKLECCKDRDPIILNLQSIVLPKLEHINRFWSNLCEHHAAALRSEYEVVLCHGDVWGGNIMDRQDRLVWIDWESAILAPAERDLFSYMGSEYAAFRRAYAEQRRIDLSLNPDLVAFYACRHQLRNLNQWLHNLLNENYGTEQKHNDLEMIEFHCLDRWPSIEATIEQLFHK